MKVNAREFRGMVESTIEDLDDSDAAKRPPSILIGLPDELAEWVDQNQELVSRVQHALADSYATLTEDHIWEVVAATCSHEWKKARQDFEAAEKMWKNLNSPMNAPLG